MAKTIMVVDDSAPVRQQVGMALRQAGFEVVEAVDGLDAIERLKTTPCAMAVCDVNMPRMNGIEFLEKVGKTLPVVMLTTEGHPDVKKKAKEAGAKGWIIKPFKPELLVEAVRMVSGG